MKEKVPLNKNKLVIGGGILLVAAVTLGGWWWVRSSAVVSTDDARVKGTIVAVSPKIAGRIEQVAVDEGDTVQAGQVIARIESDEIEVQVAQAKANLAAAQAKLNELKSGSRPQQIAQAGAATEQARAGFENAQRNYERLEALYNQGAVSAQQLDTAQTALSVAKAQYDAASQSYSLTAEGSRAEDVDIAQAQVEQAAAALKNAELTLANTEIKAPVAGIVAVKSVDQGEVVSAGQPLFNITDPNDVWVSANIEETSVGKVAVAQPVTFTIDAYPGRTFTGEVSDVGAATGSQFALLPTENTSGNFTKVTQRLPVRINVTDAGSAALKPGMSAVVDIHVK